MEDRFRKKARHIRLENTLSKNNETLRPQQDVCEDLGESQLSSLSSSSSPPPQNFEIETDFSYQERHSSFDPRRPDVVYNLLDDRENQSHSLSTSSLSLQSNQHDYGACSFATNLAVMKCPVCEKHLRDFYCSKCIQAGNFVNTQTNLPERFAEKRLKHLEFQEELAHLSAKYDKISEGRILTDSLKTQLRNLTRRTEALQKMLNDKKLELNKASKKLAEHMQNLGLEKKACKSKEGKIELINKIIKSRNAYIEKRHLDQSNYLDEVGQLVRQRAYQLKNEIFTLEEINFNEQNNSIMNMETSPLLTFSDSSHHQIEQQMAYSIVEPWLPADGDCSAYNLWINDHQEHIQGSLDSVGQRNPAYRIASALAYTTQLVSNLAFYMDISLPAKIDLNTFNRELLNEPFFSYNVAKLNANIIHLCVQQGIDVSLLNPRRTLKNLLMMFDPNISDFGRKPYLMLDNEDVAYRVEEKLSADLALVQDDCYLNKYYDDGDTSDSEWELSDSINPMEMQLANEQSIQQNSYIRMPLRFLSSIWGSNS